MKRNYADAALGTTIMPSKYRTFNSSLGGMYPGTISLISSKRGRSGSYTLVTKKKKGKFPSRLTYKGKNRKYYRPGSKFELKFYDQDANLINTVGGVNTAPNCSAYLMNGVTQGTTANQRIGKQINIKSIQVRLKLRRTNDTNVTVRILIVYVKESQVGLADTAGLDYLLQFVPSTSGVKDRTVTSALNLNNTANFVVLKDTVQELDDGHGTEFYWQYYHKCNLNSEFTTSSTTGTAADFKKGSLWLIIADNNYGTNPSIHSYHSRIRFYDA